jgi:VWFA-related protein
LEEEKVRRLFRLLVLCVVCAECFGGSIVYLRVHKNVLAERMKGGSVSRADRAHKLRSLFEAAGCSADQIAEQLFPKQDLPNVLCRLPGREPGTIVVSAPIDFDAKAQDSSQWATLALLPLMAESLGPAPHRFSLTFVGFAGHDHGLRGSSEFVKGLSKAQRGEIRAMISLEGLGRTPPVYVLGQQDALLANWLSAAGASLRMRAVPTEINARSMNAQLINGVPDFRVEDYLLDARSFQLARVPTIALQSAPAVMIPAIRKAGSWPPEISGAAFDLDLYEQIYNQLCVYVLLLDSNLGTAHAAPPVAVASATEPARGQPAATNASSAAGSANGPESASPAKPSASASLTAPTAQATSPAQTSAAAAPPNLPVFRAQTELVLMDVLVTDADGAPVRGLPASDFTLSEDGKPQQIRVFEEHGSQTNGTGKTEAAALPPGTYSNRIAASNNEPLGILLFDLLNTPAQDQTYARAQMMQFLRVMPKGEHLALFVLGTNLRIVQGFSEDPQVLIAAAQKVIREVSPLYTSEAQRQQDAGFTDEIGRHAQPTLPSRAPASAQNSLRSAQEDGSNFIGSVTQRNASTAAMEGIRTDQRTSMTLDALAAIARTVGGYPGRKNLLWLSGSFQIRLRPTENTFLAIGARTTQVANPVADLSNTASYQGAIRRVSAMLAAARLAVYPIDVRGIQMGGPDLSVGTDQSRTLVDSGNNDALSNTLRDQSETRFDERRSMLELAQQTGGQVFLNNDVRGSIARSLEEGVNYYTLAYTPEKSSGDMQFRQVAIRVDRGGVKLAYRPGYYPVARQDSLKESAAHTLAAAMQPGLPPSTMLVITARVQPPDGSSKAVRIDYTIDTGGLVFTDMPDHTQRAVLDCMAVALDRRGEIAGQVANTMDAQIPPAQFAGLQRTGLPLHQELTLPPGAYDLRLGVLDRASQKVGTVELELVTPEAGAGKP